MNRIIKIVFLFMFIFSVFSFPVFANVSFNFQSDNEKIIVFYSLTNVSNPVSINYTNQNISLPYDNYLIKIFPTNTKIQNNNGTFIIKNMESVINDRYLIIWIAIIFLIIFLGFKTIGKI